MTRETLRRSGAAIALVLAAAAPAAGQQAAPDSSGPPLTLEQALDRAQENNPDMLAQRNDTRSAHAAVRAARLDFLPSASVSNSYSYTAAGQERLSYGFGGQTPAAYSSSYRAGLSYDLSGSKLMQPSIARAEERATVQRVAGYQANLSAQVAQQYLATLQAQEQVSAAVREVERTAEHERLARARLEVGAGTPLDLRRAEVQHGQAEVTLLQRRNDYQAQLLQLGQVMGGLVPENTRLTSTFALFEPRWSADSLTALAIANNPTLLAYRASASAARTNVRAARSAYLPSLSFGLGLAGSVYSAADVNPLIASQMNGLQTAFDNCNYNNRIAALLGDAPQSCARYDPTDPAVASALRQQVRASNPRFPFDYTASPLSASMTISLPLFNGYRRERQIEEARVSSEDAQLSVRSQELKLRTDVRTSVLSLQTAYRTAQLQEQVVAKATEELRLARERFRFGVASSVEVTDAQASLAQAEQARIDAIYNYHKSLATLEALVGQPLR